MLGVATRSSTSSRSWSPQFSPPGAQAVHTYADGWINDMYSGTAPYGPPYPAPSPLYPAPNQPVQVYPVRLRPAVPDRPAPAGELIYGIITFFSSLFGADRASAHPVRDC